MYLKISKHWFRDAEGALSEVFLIVEPEPVAFIFSSNWVRSIRDISLLLQICFHSAINLTNLSCGKKISTLTDSFITPRNLVVWEVPEQTPLNSDKILIFAGGRLWCPDEQVNSYNVRAYISISSKSFTRRMFSGWSMWLVLTVVFVKLKGAGPMPKWRHTNSHKLPSHTKRRYFLWIFIYGNWKIWIGYSYFAHEISLPEISLKKCRSSILKC